MVNEEKTMLATERDGRNACRAGISPNRLLRSAEFATESLEGRSAVVVGMGGADD
jgi:hypothetical protein